MDGVDLKMRGLIGRWGLSQKEWGFFEWRFRQLVCLALVWFCDGFVLEFNLFYLSFYILINLYSVRILYHVLMPLNSYLVRFDVFLCKYKLDNLNFIFVIIQINCVCMYVYKFLSEHCFIYIIEVFVLLQRACSNFQMIYFTKQCPDCFL